MLSMQTHIQYESKNQCSYNRHGNDANQIITKHIDRSFYCKSSSGINYMLKRSRLHSKVGLISMLSS